MFEASTATKKELRPNPPNSHIVDTVYAGNQSIFSGCSEEIVKVLASAHGLTGTSDFVDFSISNVRFTPESGH